MRLIASCRFTQAANFKSTGSFRLHCNNGIIKGISQRVLYYFRLEIDLPFGVQIYDRFVHTTLETCRSNNHVCSRGVTRF